MSETIQSPAGRGAFWLQLSSEAGVLIDPSCGGTVHRLRLGGREILWGDAEPAGGGCGTRLFPGRPLLPFADRLKRGKYRWEGKDYQLPINDPEMGDAIHGFLYRSALERTNGEQMDSTGERSVTLETVLPGSRGYPWTLRVRLRYILREREFVFRMRVWNLGESTAPVSAGWHPYFLVPDDTPNAVVDEALLQVPMPLWVETGEGLQPTGRLRPVRGSAYDFRQPRPISSEELDIALFDTEAPGRQGGGALSAPVVLGGPSRAVYLYRGGAFRGIQLFIPPGRRAIAMEPITAPAESFNRPGLGVIALPPEQAMDAWALVKLRDSDVESGPSA